MRGTVGYPGQGPYYYRQRESILQLCGKRPFETDGQKYRYEYSGRKGNEWADAVKNWEMGKGAGTLWRTKLTEPPFMGIIEKKDFDNKDEDFYSSDVRSCE